MIRRKTPAPQSPAVGRRGCLPASKVRTGGPAATRDRIRACRAGGMWLSWAPCLWLLSALSEQTSLQINLPFFLSLSLLGYSFSFIRDSGNILWAQLRYIMRRTEIYFITHKLLKILVSPRESLLKISAPFLPPSPPGSQCQQ